MTGLSLRAKLTLALLTVGIASAMLVGIVAREILLRRFDEIQMNESFGRFNDDVVDYFQTFGNWDNATQQMAFGEFSRQRNQRLDQQRGRGGRAGGPPEGGPAADGRPSEGGPPPDDIERPIGRPGRGRGPRPREEDQPPFRFLLL